MALADELNLISVHKNFTFLNTITKISEANFTKLQEISSFEYLNKNCLISVEGEIPTPNIYMLVSGIMRAYISTETGKQHNKKIFSPVSFVGPLTAIIKGNPSNLSYETLTECKIYKIDFKAFIDLCKEEIELANLYIKILEFIYIEYERRSIELISMDATERYLKLKKQIPHIDDLIPQFQIASYLSITPVQLSRIRKSLNLIKA